MKFLYFGAAGLRLKKVWDSEWVTLSYEKHAFFYKSKVGTSNVDLVSPHTLVNELQLKYDYMLHEVDMMDMYELFVRHSIFFYHNST